MNDSDTLARVARLFRIILLIRSRKAGSRLGRRELADACRCGARTIQRDLDLLQGLIHLPLEYSRLAGAYILREEGWVFPLAAITLEDAMALALARGLLSAPGLPEQAAIAGALDKTTTGLSPDLRELLTNAARVFQPGRLPRDYSAAPLAAFWDAASACRTMEMDYESRHSSRHWRAVDPYAVEARDGLFWEIHGWCHDNKTILTFALDRVHAVRTRNETFTVREAEWASFLANETVGGLRGGPEITVQVRFSPEVAAYARDRRWPSTLHISAESDGGALLTGTVQGVEGLVPELLRWRRHARVLGGPELRARVAEEVQAMAALYAVEEK